jgi:hypothetical protein
MDQGAVRLAAVSQAVRSNRALFVLLNEVADQFASGNDTVYCGSDVASYNPGKLRKNTHTIFIRTKYIAYNMSFLTFKNLKFCQTSKIN